MAFKKKELVKLSLEAIGKYRLVFISDVCTFLPCTRATFYNWKIDKIDSIKEALEDNKVSLKAGIRKKWYESDNATVQIALYKLLSTPEEYRLLNNYAENQTSDLSEINKKMQELAKKTKEKELE